MAGSVGFWKHAATRKQAWKEYGGFHTERGLAMIHRVNEREFLFIFSIQRFNEPL